MVRSKTLIAGANSELSGSLKSQERSRRSSRENTRRVLLVDDHSLFRQVLAIMLEENTDLDKCLQAGSLAEARQLLAEHNGSELTLAVVDLNLPDEDSAKLIGDLHRVGTPVLAIAARGDTERLDRDSRADELLTTDTSSDDILDAVRRLVDRRRNGAPPEEGHSSV